jgi:hypothetical protein
MDALGASSLPAPVDGWMQVSYPFVFESGKPAAAEGAGKDVRRKVRSARKEDKAPRPSPDTLVKARAEFKAGRYREAARLARKSLGDGGGSAAYAVMAKAYCRLKNLPDARGAIAKLRGATRTGVKAYCKRAGLTLQ